MREHTLQVTGTPRDAEDGTAPRGGLFSDLVRARSKAAVTIEPLRAAGQQPVELTGLAPDDVVELEFEGGLRRWSRVDQLAEDLGTASRDAKPGAPIVVPHEFRFGKPTRGLGGKLALRVLRVYDIDLAGKTARQIAEGLERRLVPEPGLYRCSESGGLGEPIRELRALEKKRNLLILLHGTASNTSGSFSTLLERRGLFGDALKAYGEDVYAYEHRTLTASPIENALELGRLLPAGAVLHLVSHSRGGLIGELLCRAHLQREAAPKKKSAAPFDSLELGLFASDRAADRAALTKLAALLAKHPFRVERFVRVACPAAGTTLASGRLDRWLSVIVNLLEELPGLRGNPVVDFTSALLLAVVKERTDPATLPGLEAMMPGSPLIRLLNRSGVRVEGELATVAGDVVGAGPLGRLAVFATDLFFGTPEHDLIVDTVSMRQGTRRVRPPRHFVDRGSRVHHFNYFTNETSVRKVCEGLREASKAEARSAEERAAAPRIPRTRSAPTTPKPTLFFLPGLMGTRLAAGGKDCWIDPTALASGAIEALEIDARGVSVKPPLAAYDDLIAYLGGGHDVVPFPYDWRLSLLDAGKRFGRRLAAKLKESDRPVRILAHSSGGLVARAAFGLDGKLWQEWRDRGGSRLVLLGTPTAGSFVVPRILIGQERIVRLLEMIDLKHEPQEVRRIFSRYPGLLELLPRGGEHDFFSAGTWKNVPAIAPRAKDLAAASKARQQIDASPIDPRHVCYVAGQAPATPVGLRPATGDADPTFVATAKGDGQVAWDSGPPAGVSVWYAGVPHGSLAWHPPLFPVLADLLATGGTRRLPEEAPLVAAEPFDWVQEPVSRYPTGDDVEVAVLGPTLDQAGSEPPVRVSVVHGDLAFVDPPVAVGHYEGDPIVAAEARLDQCVGGKLSDLRRLGVYPGVVGTREVLLRPDHKPGGAIVVGLGRVGELSPGRLTEAIDAAARRYAAEVGGASGDGTCRSLALASVLIGSGEGGLAVSDCVASILRGVAVANLALEGHSRIGELHLVERYEDRAAEAAHALMRLCRGGEFGETFGAEPRMRTVTGGLRMRSYGRDEGWWERLDIRTVAGEGSLVFTVPSRRARVDMLPRSIRPKRIDKVIEAAMHGHVWDAEIGAGLFGLLVPWRLHDHAAEGRDVVLVVDDHAARYPWELVHDPSRSDARPLSVRAGMIRQLATDAGRDRVVPGMRSRALVVGDPPSDLAALDAAKKEAEAVAVLFGAKEFEVRAEIRSDGASVFAALHDPRGYQVMHLAGHGVHEYGKSLISGMVLGEDEYLTPNDVVEIGKVPELVFLNCCHLAQVRKKKSAKKATHHGSRPALAANIGAELIRLGVRAVVAAGWAIHDDAAATFARVFYERMFDGRSFGRAVREARERAFVEHPGVNTWGAYQCYGDPAFTLVKPSRVLEERADPQFVSPEDAIVEIENIVQDATSAIRVGKEDLLRRLRRAVAAVPTSWGQSAALVAGIGRAYGELGMYEEAVAYYESALKAEKASMPLAAVEQLANLRVKWAVQLADAPGAGRSGTIRSLKLINRSIADLERLLAFGPTVERFCILASSYKRMALLTKARTQQVALQKMTDHYGLAHRHAEKVTGEIDPYPLMNWLTGRVLLRWRGAKDRFADLDTWLGKIEAIAPRFEERDPGFWTATFRIEAKLLGHLVRGDLSEHKEAIAEGNLEAIHRASPRVIGASLEHLRFLMRAIDAIQGTPGSRPTLPALRDALQFVHDRIEQEPVS